MKTSMVTGGAGFIGSHLVERLLQDRDHHIVVMDNLSTGSLRNLPAHPRLTFINIDVNDWGAMSAALSSHRFTHVFHLAAMVGVERTHANPSGVLDDLDGIRNVLRLCARTRVRRLFFSSSSEVYGDTREYPQSEAATALNGANPYAIVKKIGETLLREYHETHGLDYTVIRLFNTYGPRQTSDFVIPRFIRQALADEDMTVHAAGSQTRTFCHVADTIAILAGMLNGALFLNETVNVGSPREVPIAGVARLIRREARSRSRITFGSSTGGFDTPRRLPDLSKLLARIPVAFTPLNVGIRSLLTRACEQSPDWTSPPPPRMQPCRTVEEPQESGVS